MSGSACPAEFVAFAHELAAVAGAAIRPHFRTLKTVETKSDASPVTIADRAAETAMRALISARYPTHGIVGEEHGTEQAGASHVWILDPIDGTKSFVAGLPLFGTLIALVRDGTPILGVIDQPILNERWVGVTGQATTFNGGTVRTSTRTRLDEAVLFTTSMEMFADAAEEARFRALAKAVRIKRYAGDCYAFGLLAAGFADLVVESEIHPWDFAAVIPVIRGAGGHVTDWEGRDLSVAGNARVLAAANRALAEAASRILAT